MNPLKLLSGRFRVIAMLAVMVSAFAVQSASAQYVTRLPKDSVQTGVTKYLTFTSTPNLVKSIGITALTGTGTLSFSATLEQRIDTISGAYEWVAVSGAGTLSATSGTQTIIWPIDPNQAGNGYRIKVVPSATQKTYLYGRYLRRTQ